MYNFGCDNQQLTQNAIGAIERMNQMIEQGKIVGLCIDRPADEVTSDGPWKEFRAGSLVHFTFTFDTAEE